MSEQPAAEQSGPIRAAILGYGRSGSTMHAGGVETNDEFEMAGVCDIDPQRRDQAGERFGCPVFEDYHEMLAKIAPELVIVVTRSDQHAEMAMDCLAAGAHVVVTKPWAVNAAEARRMVAAAQRTGRRFFPWLPARWGADLRALRDLIGRGAIGKVFRIRRAVCSFAARSDWQTELRYGGGYLLNWGAHVIDPPVLLGGGLKNVRSVYGRLTRRINPPDGEDNVTAMINMADGTLVQAEYAVAATPLQEWFIQGDGGTIVVADGEIAIHAQTPPNPQDPTALPTMQTQPSVTVQPVEGERFGDTHEIYRDLADELRGRGTYPVGYDDAVELPRLFDAIRASDRNDAVVRF